MSRHHCCELCGAMGGAWWSYQRKLRYGPCPDCLGFQRMSAEKGSGGCGGIVRLMPERNGPCLSMRADPHLRVKAFSYRFVMPCRRYCSRLVRECISSGTVLPCESPRGESKTCPWFLIEKSFYRREMPKKKLLLGFWTRGEEESHWVWGEK